jgi:hypothetical protein
MRKFMLSCCLLFTVTAIYAQREEYTWDYITFEESCRFLELDTAESNIWEIGSPNKLWLNGSYAGTNSVFTGGATYPVNNHSTFTLMINGENVDHYPYSVYLELMHKLDTERGKDGGFIEVSHDGGEAWTNIIDDRSACVCPGDGFDTAGLYTQSDTLFNGEYGFSGELHSWTKVRFGWEACLVKAGPGSGDSMLIRFHFISDGDDAIAGEGWNIDHIRLFSMPITGSSEGDQADRFRVWPNPASGMIHVSSGLDSRIDALRLFSITGQELFSAEETAELNLSGIPKGTYILQIRSENQVIFRKLTRN